MLPNKRLWSEILSLVGHTIDELQAWREPADLSTAQGTMFAQLINVLAEFERGLLRERVKSGLQASRARDVVLGRQ